MFRRSCKGVGDIERILSRVALRSARPRDLRQLGEALTRLPGVRSRSERSTRRCLKELNETILEHRGERDLTARAIVDNPPMVIRDGGVIAEGYDDELDDLRAIAENADNYLRGTRSPSEKSRTGIATLKLGYNRVHGYYIEISKAQADKAPAEYVRRQTLKGAERYITPELKEFEDKVSERSRASAHPREVPLRGQLLDKLLEVLGDLQQRGIRAGGTRRAHLLRRACGSAVA